MRCLCVAALATVATFTPATLRAQFAIEGGGMYLSFSGDDFTNTKAGAGFEGQIRFAVAPRSEIVEMAVLGRSSRANHSGASRPAL